MSTGAMQTNAKSQSTDSSEKFVLTKGSPERFGYEWQQYAEMRPEYEEQFRRWTPHMQPDNWQGVSFVDAGCGMGRNSYWAMHYGAKCGLAIDVDDRSLASARKVLQHYPNVTVRDLSVYDLEPSASFDIAFSIGVVHHLQEPIRALQAMAGAVKLGGRVLIWVYGRENNGWIVTFLNPLRKLLFSWAPIGLVHHLSLYPAILL